MSDPRSSEINFNNADVIMLHMVSEEVAILRGVFFKLKLRFINIFL